MTGQVEVAAERREITGKQVKRLRARGLVPCVLYGHHEESIPLQVDRELLERTFKRVGTSPVFRLKAGSGRSALVLVKQIQYHPTRGEILHVDFQRVAARERVKARVPLRFTGEPPALKVYQAAIVRQMTEVSVECYPADMPQAINVDLTQLVDTSSVIRVGDLEAGPRVTIQTPADEVVVSLVEAPKAVEVPAPEEEAVEAAEAEAKEEAEKEESEERAA